MRSHSKQTSSTTTSAGVMGNPNVQATMAAQATATAQSHIILSDSLASNIHNFPISTSGSKIYVFSHGAYHITNNGNRGLAVVLEETLPRGPLGYKLTMEEVQRDDTSIADSFGMLMRYRQPTTAHQLIYS